MAYYKSMGGNYLHFLMTRDKCGKGHFDTWRLHVTPTFVKFIDLYTVGFLVIPLKSDLITYFNIVLYCILHHLLI